MGNTTTRLTHLLIIVGSCGFTIAALAASPTTRQAIDEVIRQNEASRAKIRTIEFDYSTNQKASGHFVYRGTDRANSYNVRRLLTDCIITDSYAVTWARQSGSAPEIYLREKGKPLSEETQNRISAFAGWDPLNFGFGTMTSQVREMFERLGDRIQLRVTEERNEQNERIIRIGLLAQDMPQFEYEFNADRGYLLTGTKHYNGLGWLDGSSEVTVKQIDGVWVPVHARSNKFFFKAGTKKGEPRVQSESDFTNIRVNHPVDASRFDIASLGIPSGTEIIEYDANGKQTTRVMPTTQPAAPRS